MIPKKKLSYPKYLFYKIFYKNLLEEIKPTPMEPSDKIINFIKAYESLHDGDLSKVGLQPKLDAAGIWTEGWGHAMVRGREFLTVTQYPTLNDILPFSKVKTIEEADKLLIQDIEIFKNGVLTRLKVEVTQNQFDALLSHAFNCGYSATLYSLINKGAKESKIKNWFTTRYITAGGVYLKGLQYRRNDEYEIWSGVNYKREYNLSI